MSFADSASLCRLTSAVRSSPVSRSGSHGPSSRPGPDTISMATSKPHISLDSSTYTNVSSGPMKGFLSSSPCFGAPGSHVAWPRMARMPPREAHLQHPDWPIASKAASSPLRTLPGASQLLTFSSTPRRPSVRDLNALLSLRIRPSGSRAPVPQGWRCGHWPERTHQANWGKLTASSSPWTLFPPRWASPI